MYLLLKIYYIHISINFILVQLNGFVPIKWFLHQINVFCAAAAFASGAFYAYRLGPVCGACGGA
ncbi:MAG: hypothetical protein IJM03_13685 [Treponema sp.]|nr:hypothetical protein [Treponema sp.]